MRAHKKHNGVERQKRRNKTQVRKARVNSRQGKTSDANDAVTHLDFPVRTETLRTLCAHGTFRKAKDRLRAAQRGRDTAMTG